MPRHVFDPWGDETAENDDDDSERGNEEENDARLVNFVNNFVASAIVRICWVAEQIVWHIQLYFLRACNKFQTKEIIQILQAYDFWNSVASPCLLQAASRSPLCWQPPITKARQHTNQPVNCKNCGCGNFDSKA